MVILTDSEIRKLLQLVEPYQVVYLRSMLHCGLREVELIHTRLCTDLDLTNWMWTVQQRRPEPHCGSIACRTKGWKPKTERSARVLPVPDEPPALRESITLYLAQYPCRLGEMIFRNPRTGRAWEASALAEDFGRLCQQAGITYGRDVPGGVTPHSLRHTCFTQIVRCGVPIAVIARIARDTVKTIEDTYVHLVPDDLAEGIRRGLAWSIDQVTPLPMAGGYLHHRQTKTPAPEYQGREF